MHHYHVNLEKLAALRTELKPQQGRVVEKITQRPGLVVAHGLGSGKTLSSIAAADRLNVPTTVLVPAALQENYRKELVKHLGYVPPNIQVQSIQKALLNKEPIPRKGLLIVDEAHRLREESSVSRDFVEKFPADKKLLLTASPQYNHPADISSLVNIAAKQRLLPVNRKEFENRYIQVEEKSPGILGRIFGAKAGEVPHLKNQAELRAIADAWVDYHENPPEGFPSSSTEVHRVPMTGRQQEVYETLMDEAPLWARLKVMSNLPPSKAEARQLNAFLTGARQASGSIGPYVRDIQQEEVVKNAVKVQHAYALFKRENDRNPRHKAVIYSNYIESGLKPYEELLKRDGVPYGVFTGEQKRAERDEMVKKYNRNELKALLISSAGGEGLDLKGTRQLQILDPHWNNEKLRQVAGRAIRYQSHAHLPEEEQHVVIQKFMADPKPSLLQKIFMGGNTGVDEYLHTRAEEKDQLMQEMRDVLRSK